MEEDLEMGIQEIQGGLRMARVQGQAQVLELKLNKENQKVLEEEISKDNKEKISLKIPEKMTEKTRIKTLSIEESPKTVPAKTSLKKIRRTKRGTKTRTKTTRELPIALRTETPMISPTFSLTHAKRSFLSTKMLLLRSNVKKRELS